MIYYIISQRKRNFKVTALLMITAQTDKYKDTCADILKQTKHSQEAIDPSSLLPFQKKGLYSTNSLFSVKFYLHTVYFNQSWLSFGRQVWQHFY